MKSENFLKIIRKDKVLILLSASLVLFSFLQTGMPIAIAVIGLVFCIAGLIWGGVRTDLRMLVPMTAWVVICGFSDYNTDGDILGGYMSLFAVYPVAYMLFCYLDGRQAVIIRKLCVLWAELVGGMGIIAFGCDAFTSVAHRLGIVLGNPNALGIFLVISWFAALRLEAENGFARKSGLDKAVRFMEPLILTALVLTLSMGSFLALAVGMAVYACQEKEGATFRAAANTVLPVIARMSLYIGTGLLIFIAAGKTAIPWLAILPCLYIFMLCVNREALERFLSRHMGYSAGIAAMGLLAGIAAIMLRPGAKATFAERLEMMRNGLGYFFEHPLFGVGTYQWRRLNFYNDDKYFNTWHIHNMPIHFAAEMGIFALAIILIVFIWAVMKKENRMMRPALAAFIAHNLLDTSLLYFGVTMMLMLSGRTVSERGSELNWLIAQMIYGAFALFFIYSLLHVIAIF